VITQFKKYFLFFCLMLAASPGFAGHGGAPDVDMQDIVVGEGPEALPYSTVEVHYTGKLEDGTVFDSSVGRGQPFSFTLGAGQVIPGWEIGIQGMKTKGKRLLKIPPELAYGDRGAGNSVPPNATLIFEVELVSVTPPPFTNIGNTELQAKLKNGTQIIDIRRPEEWAETGVVEGSIKLTAFDNAGRFIPSFADELKKLVQPDEAFVLICRTGNRTGALSNWLASKGGYAQVINVEDGITAWIKEGLPVNKAN
jgi:rhodanese-related sulfurtransferase